MGIHIRNLKKDKGTKRNTKSAELIPVFTTVFKLVFVAGIIFFVVNVRVSLNEKTEKLNRDANQIRKKIGNLNREIEHLKIQKEVLSSWPHVKKKIADFNIPLKSANPAQVKNLVLLDDSVSRGKLQKDVNVSQR